MENRKAELIETLLPKDTNSYGNIFGGVIMSMMDKTAGVVCWRYSKKRVVTASAHEVTFHTGISLGEVVHCRATIVHVGRCSMEVELEVEVENVVAETMRRAASGMFTMVAVDGDLKPSPVPPWQPQTDQEREKWRQVEQRRRMK